MTAMNDRGEQSICPAQALLKLLSGKNKSDIFRLGVEGPLRFSTLMKRLEGANRQSVSVALREMEDSGLLERFVVSHKPLHVEYKLTDKARAMVPLLRQLESVSGSS